MSHHSKTWSRWRYSASRASNQSRSNVASRPGATSMRSSWWSPRSSLIAGIRNKTSLYSKQARRVDRLIDKIIVPTILRPPHLSSSIRGISIYSWLTKSPRTKIRAALGSISPAMPWPAILRLRYYNPPTHSHLSQRQGIWCLVMLRRSKNLKTSSSSASGRISRIGARSRCYAKPRKSQIRRMLSSERNSNRLSKATRSTRRKQWRSWRSKTGNWRAKCTRWSKSRRTYRSTTKTSKSTSRSSKIG